MRLDSQEVRPPLVLILIIVIFQQRHQHVVGLLELLELVVDLRHELLRAVILLSTLEHVECLLVLAETVEHVAVLEYTSPEVEDEILLKMKNSLYLVSGRLLDERERVVVLAEVDESHDLALVGDDFLRVTADH